MQHFVASLCSIKCSDFYFSLGKKCGAADIEVNTGNTESWPCSFIYAAPVVWRTLIDVSRCWGPWKIEIFIKTWNHGAELIACLEFTAVRGEREREKKRLMLYVGATPVSKRSSNFWSKTRRRLVEVAQILPRKDIWRPSVQDIQSTFLQEWCRFSLPYNFACLLTEN